MVTVQQVYDTAIHLMDEQSETNGGTVTVDTAEYKYRTISILNTAIMLLYPYSGGYSPGTSGRPACRQLYYDDYADPDFEQTVPLDDTLSLACLPYYLAAMLMSSENEDLANWFMTQFRVALNDMKNKIPADFTAISMPYGAF